MGEEKKDGAEKAPKEKKAKYKVVAVSAYYAEARKANAGNVRDTALVMLYEEYGDNIVNQVTDQKAGETKFIVKL